MKIPYGMANFADIRSQGRFYADKTGFLPALESMEDGNQYLVFLRPRRFGKSLLVSMLRYYYDLAEGDRFEALFSGLWIHDHPTEEHNRYLVLHFDFSPVDASGGEQILRDGFTSSVRESVRALVLRYRDRFPALEELIERTAHLEDATSIFNALVTMVQACGQTLYVLIDEYDSVPNDLLARGARALYQDMVMDRGFMRTFYKAIKSGAQAGVVRRIFITGVTPVPLDDMASGFNISTNISFEPGFNELCGLTHAEVSDAVAEFLALTPGLGEPAALEETLAASYDGYRFATRATELLFNPDMVLYYLRRLRVDEAPPAELLDLNVRTDYTKIRALATPSGGNRDWHLDFIRRLLLEGGVSGTLVESFGSEHMYDERHLTSLLCHMGMLTLGGVVKGRPYFVIPNRVIRTLHWEELALLLHHQGGATVDIEPLLDAVSVMAWDGNPGIFLELIREGTLKVLSNRDLIRFDEKHLKLILLTYLSFSPIYLPVSEQELAQGYGDILLALDNRFPDAKYAYVLELKHLKAGASEAAIAEARAGAVTQLERYVTDPRLPALLGHRTILATSLVFVGATAVHWWIEQTLAPGTTAPDSSGK